MSTDDKMDKGNGVYPCKGYYSASWKEILTLLTTWMDLEAIMLNEMNQEL